MKGKVYLKITIPTYLTPCASHDFHDAAHQQSAGTTNRVWDVRDSLVASKQIILRWTNGLDHVVNTDNVMLKVKVDTESVDFWCRGIALLLARRRPHDICAKTLHLALN
jgi:hypothetical protein